MHSKRPDLFVVSSSWDIVHARKQKRKEKKKYHTNCHTLRLYTIGLIIFLHFIGLILAIDMYSMDDGVGCAGGTHQERVHDVSVQYYLFMATN